MTKKSIKKYISTLTIPIILLLILFTVMYIFYNKKDNTNPEVIRYYNLAHELYRDKEYHAGVRYHVKSYELDNSDVHDAYRIGYEYAYHINDGTKALRYLKIVEHNKPNDIFYANLYSHLGYSYQLVGRDLKNGEDSLQRLKMINTSLIYFRKALNSSDLDSSLWLKDWIYNQIGKSYHHYYGWSSVGFEMVNTDSARKAIPYFDTAYSIQKDMRYIINKGSAYKLIANSFNHNNLDSSKYYDIKAYECFKMAANEYEEAAIEVKRYETIRTYIFK